MLFTVKKENIIEGLQKAAGIIPTRAGAAYLRSLWIKAEGEVLTIMATDANIEFTGTYPADVKEPGLVGVNGRNFVDLVRRLPAGELRIRLDDATGTVILEQGRRTYKLPANDPTWFQSLAPFSSEGAVVWSGDFFQEIIDRVFFCVSDDESSDAIACLYFKPVGEGHIEVCGLNGHQFALTRFTHDDLSARLPEDGVLIQRKYVGELRKWLGGDEIEVNLTDKRLFVRSGDGHETLSLPRRIRLPRLLAVHDPSGEPRRVPAQAEPEGLPRRARSYQHLQHGERSVYVFRTVQRRGHAFRAGAGHRVGQRVP